tara:strand:+ start:726 stop:923 length:198 start_codon:yes stop_codon:yes gene_type:complete
MERKTKEYTRRAIDKYRENLKSNPVYAEKQEKAKARQREYYQKNKEKIKERSRNNYIKKKNLIEC